MRNPNATVLLEVVIAVDAAVDRPGLTGDAEGGTDDAAVANQDGDDALGGVARDGKTDALRHGDDRGIDAHHLAARIDQRATGIPGFGRGTGLDNVLDRPAALGAHRAADGADNAGRHAGLKTEGMPNRNHQLP